MLCKPPFSGYDFSHDVWWNVEMLEFLNISQEHVRLLASTVQSIAYGKDTQIPHVLMPYMKKAATIVSTGYNVTYSQVLASIHKDLEQTMDLNYL